MKKKRIVALLPLKVNSERVKRKNFRSLAGKPLFRWILDSLLAVEEIDCVVINTDAREILRENGLVESDKVIIRDRKPELCGDMVSMNLILQDDINAIDADAYLMTHTTNPLITSQTIRDGFKKWASNSDRDSLFSVNKIQTRFYREDCSAVNHNPDKLLRTQDLEPWYEENSCLYYFSKKSFEKTRARIGKNPIMMVTPPLESLDIDELHDWEMVTALAEHNLTTINDPLGKLNAKTSVKQSTLVNLSLVENENETSNPQFDAPETKYNFK